MDPNEAPIFRVNQATQTDQNPLDLTDRIRHLVDREMYCVLCTQGEGQPYGSVIAFAFTQDLCTAVFCTPRATRKYRLLRECERIALVVDSRDKSPDEMMQVEAITVTGRAREVEARTPLCEECQKLFTTKHPHLRGFVESPSTALFKVEVIRFFHVERFQEVHQWAPKKGG